ncbi:MAG: membrane protein insertase YidC [Candidatus Competibacteraceae bacterium]
MDNQRLFPLLALLFILFLLWENWLQFQAQKHPPPKAPVPAATIQGETTAPAPGAPAQDIPNQVPSAAAPTLTAPVESGQRVKVVTDVYEAEIDTIGGDLRRLGLRTYPESLQQPKQPFELLEDSATHFFIVQSGLKADNNPAPSHYARFVTEQTEYRLQDGQNSLEVKLTWSEGGITVTKSYTFQRGSFVIDLKQRVDNASPQEWRGWQYRQLQRTPPPSQGGMFSGVYTYTGGVISTPEEKYKRVSFDTMAKEPVNLTVKGGWVAMIQHYFLAALVPGQEQTDLFYSNVIDGGRYALGMLGQPQTVAPGSSGEFSTRLYAGPKLQNVLAELAPNLQLTVDYGILTIIAEPLFWLLRMIHKVVGNWGWAIIILTILIKAVFFKLSETSYRSMAQMRNLAPKINSLKERYGDDKQRMNQAMMELYKKEKINPLGGCLPIAVQIPVFIALYWMLLESVELRQAPFMFWIHDLSVKDPYYVLPIIMGITMVVQQKLNPPPADPTQAKMMMILPIVFTFMFLWFPAGLVLYWTVSNILSIAQQYAITKRMGALHVAT